jgi:hypothetical protein
MGFDLFLLFVRVFLRENVCLISYFNISIKLFCGDVNIHCISIMYIVAVNRFHARLYIKDVYHCSCSSFLFFFFNDNIT